MVGEWISVKDRLPEKNTQVLVFSRGWYVVCWYAPLNIAATWYDGDTRWTGVTHWMPLPDPPKEGC